MLKAEGEEGKAKWHREQWRLSAEECCKQSLESSPLHEACSGPGWCAQWVGPKGCQLIPAGYVARLQAQSPGACRGS